MWGAAVSDADPSVVVSGVDPLIGQTLGAYVVKALLGDGGMAQVYRAEHQTIGRQMAVKVLKAEVAAQSEWHQRFIAEAQVIAALKHRNIVEVFDFGQLPDGRQYIMMEYVQGEPLDAYISQHAPLPPAVALDFADQILNALGEAHKKGIVHRDLKPANVMLVREHNNESLLKVLDFGLARQDALALSVEPGQQQAKASLLAGTPAYVAPEQALGEVVDGRADVYALGVMLFEMLSGQLPFAAADDRGLVEMHVSTPAPSLDSVANNMPEGLTTLVASLLSKSRDERPPTADAARQAVQRVIKQLRSDATAVRPHPGLRHDAASSQHAPTDRIERPATAPVGHSTDLALAAVRPSPWPRRVAVVAVLALLLFLVFRWWPEAPKEVAQPVVVSPPVAEVVPPPAPEEVVPLPHVAPPEPPEAPVEASAPVAAKAPVAVKAVGSDATPKLVVVKPTTVAVVKAPDCEPTAVWREGMRRQLSDLGRMAAGISVQEGVWFDGRESELSRRLEAATTPGECAALTGDIDRLQGEVRKKLGR